MKWPYKNNKNNYIFIIGELFTLIFIILLMSESIFDYLGDGFLEMSTRSNVNWAMAIIFLFGFLIRVFGISLEFYI